MGSPTDDYIEDWAGEIESCGSRTVQDCVRQIWKEGFEAAEKDFELREAAKIVCYEARKVFSSMAFLDLPEMHPEWFRRIGETINDLAEVLGLNKEKSDGQG